MERAVSPCMAHRAGSTFLGGKYFICTPTRV